MNSIYVHIPFCKSICTYCDFTKFYYKREWVDTYLDELEKEISQYLFDEKTYTLYIGGGTPTSLSLLQMERLLSMLDRFSDCIEYTVECNPENLTVEKLQLMKKHGVNRLSIGVQSFQDHLLEAIDRKHKKEDVLLCIENAKKIGFNNISIDMMYNLPHQTLELLEEDLKMISTLDIQHFSYYSLILEEHTILAYHKYQLEDDYEMSEMIKNYPLPFKRYEVSNYALPGYESKHNLVYWHNEHYYGLGCGAHGYLENRRYYNTSSITKYLKGNNEIVSEIVEKDDRIFETIMLGLRLVQGIDLNQFESRYGIKIEECYPFEIQNNIEKGLLQYVGNYLTTTQKGFDLLDSILLDFVK